MTFDEFKALPGGSVVCLDSRLVFRKEPDNSMWRFLRRDGSESPSLYYNSGFSSVFGRIERSDRIVQLSELEILSLAVRRA